MSLKQCCTDLNSLSIDAVAELQKANLVIWVVVDMVRSKSKRAEIFTKLTRVTDKFVKVPMHCLGAIPDCPYIKHAVKQQRFLYEAYPGFKSAEGFGGIAQSLEKLPRPVHANGYTQFFFEQFMRPLINGVVS